MNSSRILKLIANLLMNVLSSLEKRKNEADECNQKIIYSEVYGRSKNLKFERIAEASQLEARTMVKLSSGTFLKT